MKKTRQAPKCVVGDKVGCGLERRQDGWHIMYFTHNSKSVSERICCIPVIMKYLFSKLIFSLS